MQGVPAPINCLLHAGGVLADGLIARQSLAGIRAVFAAKASLPLQRCCANPWHDCLYFCVASCDFISIFERLIVLHPAAGR